MAAQRKTAKAVSNTKAKSAAKKKPVKKVPAKATKVAKAKPTKKPAAKTAAKPVAVSRKPRKTKLEKGLAEIAGLDEAVWSGDKRIVVKPEWFIVNIYVDNGYVYGLANDQRVYRWNHRSALWVLHKEGLQP